MADETAINMVREALLQVLRERSPSWERGSDVGHVARELGRSMGLPEDRITPMFHAAELHGIGKVAIPDAILNKPGGLDREEWEIMRGHVDAAVRILSVVEGLEDAAQIIRCVYEHYDGTGYPRKLAGDDIPVEARIIHVCVAFHAMTVARPYRAGLDIDTALQQLHDGAGTQFDPTVVRELVGLLDALQA